MTAPALRDEVKVSKGEVIFRQGDPGNEMFVVAQGRVRLTIGTEGYEKEVGVVGPGEFFGELSLLRDTPRTATAEALEDATLLAIGRDVFAMMMQDDLDIVFRMMHTQGQRLSQANEPVQRLTEQLGYLRIATHALRHLLGSTNVPPATLNVAGLAAELRLSPAIVGAAVAGLVRRGAGTLDAGVWRFGDAGQFGKLLEVVCQYAEDHMGSEAEQKRETYGG
jgi:CRP-like cAMP-binding protein